MRRLLYICILVLSAMSMMAENYASNARAEQVERTMVITYDLSKTANVRLLVSTNMSNDFKEVKKVTGAVGENVQAGANRRITWNVLEEYDRFVADGVRFKVEAYGAEGIGVFSVSSSKKVTFSPGNLQYTRSTDTWSFAENQWDYIGTDNVKGGTVECDPKYGYEKEGSSLADKIDLFGWSISSTNYGVNTSTTYNSYGESFVDWGNKIGNSGPNTWRTLTNEEWGYLFDRRPDAKLLRGVASVNGVNGLILLPDTWVCPSGVTFKYGFSRDYGVEEYGQYQTFTANQWSMLEAAGAVFLPASGMRKSLDVIHVLYEGFYWFASAPASALSEHYFHFTTGSERFDVVSASTVYGPGCSVRLVKDL